MGSVLANFIPLALGSIAPVMIMLVVVMLGAKDGLQKALAFSLGKFLVYLILGFALYTVGGNLSDEGGDSSEQSTVVSAIKLVLGAIFLVMALKTLVGEPDPDAGPPKLLVKLQSMSVPLTFGAGFALSLIQLRFLLLLVAGISIIRDADLSSTSNMILIVVLAFALVWTLLVPIIVYSAMGDRGPAAMASLQSWLGKHSRVINIIVLTIFGLVLLRSGIQGLF